MVDPVAAGDECWENITSDACSVSAAVDKSNFLIKVLIYLNLCCLLPFLLFPRVLFISFRVCSGLIFISLSLAFSVIGSPLPHVGPFNFATSYVLVAYSTIDPRECFWSSASSALFDFQFSPALLRRVPFSSPVMSIAFSTLQFECSTHEYCCTLGRDREFSSVFILRGLLMNDLSLSSTIF